MYKFVSTISSINIFGRRLLHPPTPSLWLKSVNNKDKIGFNNINCTVYNKIQNFFDTWWPIPKHQEHTTTRVGSKLVPTQPTLHGYSPPQSRGCWTARARTRPDISATSGSDKCRDGVRLLDWFTFWQIPILTDTNVPQ